MTFSRTFLAVLSLSLAATSNADACSACEGVHIFLARGNNEPYLGRQAALVEAVCNGLKSCGDEDLICSALFADMYC
jgi:hypothetical protein